MLDQDTGPTLREKIGIFREVDIRDDGLAVGRVLRIKVVIDILGRSHLKTNPGAHSIKHKEMYKN